MANRNYNRYQALEKEVKALYADVDIGAAGAPTIVKALGITSIARDSDGVYTITLDDKYTRLLHVDVKQLVSAAEDLTFQLVSEDVAGSKEISLRCLAAAAVETDPSNGSKLLIKIELKNSSVGE
ncbi:MAG: hypothetical protein FMNOHCHN_03732 [Ignavibacteriaceae bacterium]|nr:hypothetical protein [Ignavibacteriaceae bacterium]